MTKKYFFFDIDGTLTDRKTHKIIPSAQNALLKLQENGHFVAIATGRAHYKAKSFIEAINVKHMVCAGGGGLVYHNELIENTPLDRQKAIALYEEAKALGFGILVAIDDSIDVYSENDLFRQQVGERKELTRYFIDSNFDIHQQEAIYKLYIAVSSEDEHQLKTLKSLGFLRFEQEYLNIQYDDKLSGIIKLVQYVGGNLEDVVVFGDDLNDMVMFDSRFTCIAMGNAHEQLKQKATFVTKANVDDGIAYALKHFKWI